MGLTFMSRMVLVVKEIYRSLQHLAASGVFLSLLTLTEYTDICVYIPHRRDQVCQVKF